MTFWGMCFFSSFFFLGSFNGIDLDAEIVYGQLVFWIPSGGLDIVLWEISGVFVAGLKI